MSMDTLPAVTPRPTPLATRRLQPLILLLGAALVLCGLYFDTARSIVEIWNSSETFAHGYIILPISLWLVWNRRARLASVPLAPYWPGLLPLLACGAAWLLAELADVQVVRHYAFVAMLPACALVILGRRMATALAFPLLYLLLAVPFGDIFIAPLIRVTADFTVWAVQASGIPVLRDGPNFSLPSGNWSVVEACSGVRYLIASFTLGCLYAYLTYRTLTRRLLFVAASILVPIAANGLRAYMIVMIGHLSGMELAVGVDHLIYGWLFFGLVMFLMYWIGGFWRQDLPPLARISATAPALAAPGQRFAVAALAAIACAAVWPLLAQAERTGRSEAAPDLSTLDAGWQAAPAFAPWTPAFNTPRARFERSYASGADRAGLAVYYYRDSARGAGPIASTNRLTKPKERDWLAGAGGTRTETIAGRPLAVRETPLRGPHGAILVWQWYEIGGRALVNDYAGKAALAANRLRHGSDDAAVLFAYAPLGERAEDARAVLRRFAADGLPRIERTLAQNAAQGERR
jgi:exosortase A